MLCSLRCGKGAYDLCRRASHNRVWRHVASDDGTGCHHGMTAYAHTGQHYGIGTDPYVVGNADGACLDALPVDALRCVYETVVQRCHNHALGQVDMAADIDGAYHGVVQTYACVVAYDDIAHGVVDTAEALDNAAPSKLKATVGWGVHAHAAINLAAAAAVLVEWGQQSDIPAWTGITLVHYDHVKPSLQSRVVIQPDCGGVCVVWRCVLRLSIVGHAVLF